MALSGEVGDVVADDYLCFVLCRCSLFFVSVPCGIDFSCLCEDYALRGSTVVFVLLSLSWCS